MREVAPSAGESLAWVTRLNLLFTYLTLSIPYDRAYYIARMVNLNSLRMILFALDGKTYR